MSKLLPFTAELLTLRHSMLLVIPLINCWSRCEWSWMRVWLSFWGYSSLLSSPTSYSVIRVVGGGEVVVILIVVPLVLLHPILSSLFLWMLWINVSRKASGQHLAGNGLHNLYWVLLLLLLLLSICIPRKCQGWTATYLLNSKYVQLISA